jgi:hypothetical protein
MNRRPWIAALVALPLLTFAPQRLCAVTVGNLDDFNDGGAMDPLEGWANQGSFTGGLTRQASGGPAGASDAYLRVASTGGSQSFGKLVAFNQSETWNGDYLAAGVVKISMDVNNLGTNPLMLRVALGTGSAPLAGGDWMVTTAGVSLPVASGWTNIEFPLGPGDFTGDDFLDVIGDVVTLRIFHAVSANTDGIGEPIMAALGVDNIRAVGAANIPGDFNHVDGVNAADLAKWRTDFGGAGSDADGDQDSDGDDFLIWQRNLGMGTSVPAAVTVPEPAGAALIATAALLTAAHARRRSARGSQ